MRSQYELGKVCPFFGFNPPFGSDDTHDYMRSLQVYSFAHDILATITQFDYNCLEVMHTFGALVFKSKTYRTWLPVVVEEVTH